MAPVPDHSRATDDGSGRPWWHTWRTSKWEGLQSQVPWPRKPLPHESFIHVIDDDIPILDRVSAAIRSFKRELLHLKNCEQKPPPTADSSPELPDPSPSPDTDPGPGAADDEPIEGIPRRQSFHTALPDEDRRRRRDMARKIAVAAEKLKAEQKRRQNAILTSHQRKRQQSSASDTRTAHQSSYGRSPPSLSPIIDLPAYFESEHIPRDDSTPYQDAWIRYATAWKAIDKPDAGAAGNRYTFETLPWPVLRAPSSLKDLDKDAISAFFQHGPPLFRPSARKENRNALHQAVRRWHPDRLRWITRVDDQDHEMVRKGSDIVIRVLNQLTGEDREVTDAAT